MKYFIPVLLAGATITAAITTALAQAHGAFIGNVSLTPYLLSYGVSAVLLLIAGGFAINAHRQESPQGIVTSLPLTTPPPALGDAPRDYAVSFVEGWAEDGILFVRVGAASGASVSNITAQITYYDSQGRPYRVMEGIWRESGQPLLEAMPTIGTLILAVTTDGKTVFAPRPSTGAVELKSGRGFIAIRLHFTLYGSQPCDLPPLMFSIRLGKQMSVSLTDSIVEGDVSIRKPESPSRSSSAAHDILREAIRAVPVLKYALGIAGILAVIAIVRGFGIDPRLGVLGAAVMLVLMTVLVVFSRLTSTPKNHFVKPALVFMWFSLLLTMFTATGLFTSVFFRWPLDLRQWIVGQGHEPKSTASLEKMSTPNEDANLGNGSAPAVSNKTQPSSPPHSSAPTTPSSNDSQSTSLPSTKLNSGATTLPRMRTQKKTSLKQDADAKSPANDEECGVSNGTFSNGVYRNGAVPDLSSNCNSRFTNNLTLSNGRPKLTVGGKENEITHNTFPEMDVTTTEKSQGNKLQDNLFKNPVVPGQMPTAKNGSGANTAEIYKAQTRNQYPGGFPDTPWPIANTVLHGTNASVIDQLDHLIDEAHKIVADFRKDHNAQSIQEREKTWEAESTSALKANLGQSFAEEFDEKELASDPNRLNTEGSKICNLIDAKIDVLSIFANQLGATNH